MHLLSRTECNARWLLYLINNNFLNFLTETILNSYLIEFSYPKNPKMCDPIPVTLLKMQPILVNRVVKNATPSSGTSPFASYKEVPPPPPGQCTFKKSGCLHKPPTPIIDINIALCNWALDMQCNMMDNSQSTPQHCVVFNVSTM